MREIKFRAWDKKEHKMIYSFGEPVGNKDSLLSYILAQLKDNSIAIITEGDSYKLKLMQYTGIKDKNGKEIYEGDIVYIKKIAWPGQGKEKKIADYISPVTFECGCFHWFDGYGYWTPSQPCFITEIIGNIYENPELLK